MHGGLGWGAVAGQPACDQPDVVAGDVRQVAFVDVGAAAQPGSAQATTIQDQSEPALDELGAQRERGLGDPGEQPGAVVVDDPPGGVIAAPAHHELTLRLALPPKRHRHPPRSANIQAAMAISSTGY